MGDIVGRLFREFAVTLAVTILVSAIVSLTLTPMMCSKLLKHSPEADQTRFYRVTEPGWKAIISFYDRTLQVVLRHQTMTLVVAAATLVLTILLYIYVPKGFFPIQDTGVIQGISQASESVSFPEMANLQQELDKIILKDPAVESLSSFIGIDGTNTTLNSGRILINLKPLDERKIDASEVIRRLQPELASVPGITLFMQPVQDITVEDRVSRTQFQYTLEDPNADELYSFAPRMLEKLRESPLLRDVASDQEVGGLCTQLVFDRSTAYRFGISPSTIDQTLYDAYGQREVSTIYTQLNQYHVVLEVDPSYRQNPLDLRDLFIRTNAASSAGSSGLVAGGSASTQLYGPTSSLTAANTSLSNSTSGAGLSTTIPSDNAFGGAQIASTPQFPNGGQVPLAAFTHVEETNVPLTVNHQGQFPVVTLSFNLAPQASLGDAITAVNKVKDESHMPAADSGGLSGNRGVVPGIALQRARADPGGACYGLHRLGGFVRKLHSSHHHSVHAAFRRCRSACLSLLICRIDFSVIALIGLVLLIGIVKKNGIMMIDFALEAERKEGMTPVNAIYQACLLRFRPIMMTTMAALLGGVPLALGTGMGSELRRPLGITMVGGLLLSQLLTLYTTPVIYLWFDRLALRFSRGRHGNAGVDLAPAD